MNILAQFGRIDPPPAIDAYSGGLSAFISNIIKTAIVIAALWALFNFVLAGYAFLSAGDDPKKVAGAWAKIWQSVLGLTIAAGAFVLAGIFGQILFDDPLAFLTVRVFGPN